MLLARPRALADTALARAPWPGKIGPRPLQDGGPVDVRRGFHRISQLGLCSTTMREFPQLAQPLLSEPTFPGLACSRGADFQRERSESISIAYPRDLRLPNATPRDR